MDVFVPYLILGLKITGVLLVVYASARLFYFYLAHTVSNDSNKPFIYKVSFVGLLLLAFEILVGAGILTTVLKPSWNDIGKLAAIAALRTLIKKNLNYNIRKKHERPA